jgi:UDP-glucose 4-epimerase
VYVGDVAEANILAAERGAPGEVYLIASGVETSINDVVAAIGRVSGTPVSVTYGAPRPGDIYRSVGDGSKAMRELGWVPRVSLDQGIKRILEA